MYALRALRVWGSGGDDSKKEIKGTSNVTITHVHIRLKANKLKQTCRNPFSLFHTNKSYIRGSTCLCVCHRYVGVLLFFFCLFNGLVMCRFVLFLLFFLNINFEVLCRKTSKYLISRQKKFGTPRPRFALIFFLRLFNVCCCRFNLRPFGFHFYNSLRKKERHETVINLNHKS